MTDLARQLAARICDTVPSATAREVSRQAIVDVVGVTIAGAAAPASRIAAELAPVGVGNALLLGTPQRTTLESAALANGVAAHVLDFDDGHPVAMAHPSAVLLPALLGVAEEHRMPGSAVVSAHAVGVRVFAAIGGVINPHHYLRGWHATSSIGTIAAAAAVAALLSLTPEQTAHALGIAATQSGGTRRNFGSMTKSFHAGWAAHAGLVAARLAAKGFTAGGEVFEGRGGWLDIMIGDGASRGPEIVAGLDADDDAAALAMSLKRFAACGTTHTPLEAALQLRDQEAIDPGEIASIDCDVHESTFEILRAGEPRSGLEGKFSLEHCLAVALIDGDAGLPQFTDERVASAEVRALARRVRLHARETAASVDTETGLEADKWSTRVRITLADGSEFARTVHRRRGSFSFEPMGDEERRAKFAGCLLSVGYPADRAAAAFDLVEAFGDAVDARVVTESLAALAPGD